MISDQLLVISKMQGSCDLVNLVLGKTFFIPFISTRKESLFVFQIHVVSSFEEKWAIHSSYCEKTIVFCF